MELYLLRAKPKQPAWEPWYDKSFGFVVRAKNEPEARQLASTQSGEEGSQAWLDESQSTCIILEKEGDPQIIIQDFASA